MYSKHKCRFRVKFPYADKLGSTWTTQTIVSLFNGS